MANNEDKNIEGDRLLKAVDAIAISPSDVRKYVGQVKAKARESRPNASDWEIQDYSAEKIVQRYCALAATSGGVSALPGIVPGAGTLVAAGTALGDATICMKLQVDMTMCLAEAYGYDVTETDARQLAFLVAAGAAVQQAGGKAAVQIGTKAGVKMVQQYLKGAALQAVKELFKKLGITFTRKALEKAIPFGVGVIIGVGANYVLTKFVGSQAKRWFVIDRDMRSAAP